MKEVKLKDQTIFVSVSDEKHLANLLGIVAVNSFEEMTHEQFTNALMTEKLCSGETISLPNGARIRVRN